MYFSPFVIQANTGKPIEVIIDAAESDDLETTHICLLLGWISTL